MTSNVVGLFDTPEQAQIAVNRLIADGIPSNDISLVLSDPKGKIHTEYVDRSGDMASAGAVTGAASGIVVGGLIGLLVGATTLVAPPAGFFMAGPIAGMLTGMGLGFAGGTLLGALVGLGLPEDEAHVYAESVRRGSILVIAKVDETNRLFVEQIFSMAGAVNVVERGNLYRSTGFTAYDPNAPVYTPEQILAEREQAVIVPPVTPTAVAVPVAAPVVAPVVPEVVAPVVTEAVTPVVPPIVPPSVAATIGDELYIPDDLFMEDYWANYAPLGMTFAEVREAYRFGYDLATRPEFRNLDWSLAVTDAKNLWEQNHFGTWERYRGAIHLGWSKAGVRANSGATLL